MTNRDLAAFSLLLTHHINPDGCFELDMEARIPIEAFVEFVFVRFAAGCTNVGVTHI